MPVGDLVDRVTSVDVDARHTAALPLALVADVAHAADLAERDIAESTKDRYRRAWARFAAWCSGGYDGVELQALPAAPEVVATYVGTLEKRRVAWSTVGLALAAIAWEHARHNLRSPTTSPLIGRIRKSTRRSLGTAPRKPRRALEVAELQALVDTCGDGPRGARDRALLLLGFAGAFRKGELVALQVSNLEPFGADLVVRLEHSKADQEGAGRCVGIPFGTSLSFCPVRAVRAWQAVAGVDAGPLFRPIRRGGAVKDWPLAGRDVGKILKKRAKLAQLERIGRLGAHSLRHGFITEAARRGASLEAIAAHVGHSQIESTRGYLAAFEALSAANAARVIFCVSLAA